MVRRPGVMSAYLAREAEVKRLPKHILKLLRYLLIFSALGGAFALFPLNIALLSHSLAGLAMSILVGRWMIQWEAVCELVLAEPDTVKRAVRKFGVVLIAWALLSAALILNIQF